MVGIIIFSLTRANGLGVRHHRCTLVSVDSRPLGQYRCHDCFQGKADDIGTQICLMVPEALVGSSQ